MNFNKLMYRFMRNHKFGQAGSRFKEIEDNLIHPILNNKSAQETRWIRAELRSIQAFLRNLPTFCHILEQEIQSCEESGDLTSKQKAEAQLKRLRNPKMIAYAVGLCEILDDYAQLSLVGQDFMLFPSTIASVYEAFCCRLKKLSETWVWRNQDLKFAGISKPKEIIDNLASGTFKCEVSEKVKIAAARRMNINIKEKNRINAEMAELADEALENLQNDLIKPENINEGEVLVICDPSSIKDIGKQVMKIVQRYFGMFGKKDPDP